MLLFGTLHLGARSGDAARINRYRVSRLAANVVRSSERGSRPRLPRKGDHKIARKMKVVLTVFPMPILCDWLAIVFASPSFHFVIDAFWLLVPRSLRLFSLCNLFSYLEFAPFVKERLHTFDKGDCEHDVLTYEEPHVLSSYVSTRKIKERTIDVYIDRRLDEN